MTPASALAYAVALIQVLLTLPFYAIAISFDRLLAARGLTNPLLFGVPRNAIDIERRPQVFFRMLCKPKGALPSEAQLIALEREGGVDTEPGKNKSVRNVITECYMISRLCCLESSTGHTNAPIPRIDLALQDRVPARTW